METRHADNDGSDIFWPGYVDAVTNLVLNLLFLLTIMTVAVFMFALELGRNGKGGLAKPPIASIKHDAEVVSKDATDPLKENIALKREIERLNLKLAQLVPQDAKPAKPVQPKPLEQLQQPEQPVQLGGLVKTIDATANAPKPLNGVDKAIASDPEIIVLFKADAVEFTPAEHDDFLKKLQPFVARGKASILVEVPASFTEAKRMGLYRVLAVRNLLLEMKIPKENIAVSVLEGKNSANASLVRVR